MPLTDADLATLYERYAPALLRRARAILGDDHVAVEALEQTFVLALQHDGERRDAPSPLHWLYRLSTRVLARARVYEGLGAAVDRDAADVERTWATLDAPSRKRAIYLWFDRCTPEEIALLVPEPSDGADPFATPGREVPEGLGMSALQLDRFATGEVSGPERGEIQAWAMRDPYGLRHLEELRAARKILPLLAITKLRDRAGVPAPAAEVKPHAAPPPETRAEAPPASVTLPPDEPQPAPPAAMHVAPPPPEAPGAPDTPLDDDDAAPFAADEAPTPPVRARRKWRVAWALVPFAVLFVFLTMLLQREETPVGPAAATALSIVATRTPVQRDTLFDYAIHTAGRSRFVLLSLDSHGKVRVHRPEAGTVAEAAPADQRVTGTLPPHERRGTMVYVAVFDADVSEAGRRVAEAYAAGGTSGVLGWAQVASDADALLLEIP